MRKLECETAIKSLCHTWTSEQLNAELVRPSFSKFTSWLDANRYSHYLKFKSRAGPHYDAEMWFDAELKETRRRATVTDMAEILDQLAAAASPTARGSVSLREIIMRLEQHTVTNDELDALRKLKEAGPDADAPLLAYVRTVFAKRCVGVDGWRMK
jgi:hypothetical protein